MNTVKIVDTFNGGEHGSFKTQEAAEKALTKMCKAFYSTPGTQNVTWKREIVPVKAEWGFNHRTNQWEWE